MSVSCDPSTLMQAAACFDKCDPPGIQKSIKTYLLCQKAQTGMGPGCVIPAQVQDWANRVIANGGPATGPNNQTLCAAANLYTAMSNAGIVSKMKTVNIIAPPQTPGFDINHYSLTDWAMARTPFIKGVGTRDPYLPLTEPGQQAQLGTYGYCPVTIGCQPCPLGETLLTGIFPNLVFGAGDGGLTAYITRYASQTLKPDFSDNNTVVGCADGGGFQPAFTLITWQKGTNQCNFQSYAVGTVVAPASPQKYGFYSASRLNANDSRLYFANSITPIAQIGSNFGANATTPPATELTLGGIYNSLNPTITNSCDQFIGFFACHSGLTFLETTALYNAVQTYLTAVGTGAV